MIRPATFAITISLLFHASALGQFIAPELTTGDLTGPAPGYENALSSQQLIDFNNLIKNPGLDEDNDGVPDLQEFLTGGDHVNHDENAPGRMANFNLALALATDWITTDGYGGSSANDLQERLDQVFGAGVATLPPYLPGLSPTLETQFHKELTALAKKLEYDPVKIYEWVYANIEFEDYALSHKGALATYRTLRGNEWDQCSLLIALLRMSGVPARYATGDTYTRVGGTINFDKDMVMVQAWLPASPYKIPNDTNLDSPNRAWITLVPWQKTTRTVTEGIDLFPVSSNGLVLVPNELDITSSLLISRWEFESITNSTIDDIQGGHDATVSGAVTAVTDPVRPGKVAQFNPINGLTYIKISPHPDINTTSFTKRTISLWFKDDAVSNPAIAEVLYSQGIVKSGLNIYLYDGRVYAGTYNHNIAPNLGQWASLSYTDVDPDGWHHVVVVLDAEIPFVSGNNNLRLYLDGVTNTASAAASHVDPDTLATPELKEQAHIGNSPASIRMADNHQLSSTRYFTGRIDSVSIYGGALSTNQVNEIFQGNEVTAPPKYLNPSLTDDFDAHTQKTSVEFLEDTIQGHLSSHYPGKSLKDVPKQQEILTVPGGSIPTTAPYALGGLVTTSGQNEFIDDIAKTRDPASPLADRRSWSEIEVTKIVPNTVTFPGIDDKSLSGTPPAYVGGLFGYWPMDGPGGTHPALSLPGYAAYSYDDPKNWVGVVSNGNMWSSSGGLINGALIFDGTSYKVDLDETSIGVGTPLSGHQPIEEYTITMWIKVDPALQDGAYVLFEEGGDEGGIALRLRQDVEYFPGPNPPPPDRTLYLQGAVKTGPSATPITIQAGGASVEALTDGNWHFVAFLYKPGTSNGWMSLYLDGATVQTESQLTTGQIQAHSGLAGLGYRRGTDAFNDSEPNNYFKGMMDEVRVYRYALTTTQSGDLETIYQAGLDIIQPPTILTERLYLPQIAGRRLILASTPTGIPDPYSQERPILKLDGQILNNAGGYQDGVSVISGESSPDRLEIAYRHRGQDWQERPTVRPGALLNITLDTLGASAGRIAELKAELAALATDTAFDSEEPEAQEAYLGRLAAIQSETYNYRSADAARRVDELLNIRRIQHVYAAVNEPDSDPVVTTNTSVNLVSQFNMLWTYPGQASSLPGLTSEGSSHLVLAAWRNDNVHTQGYALKQYGTTNNYVVAPATLPFSQFARLVAGHTRSYLESRIFEDWQGTPALSTIGGIFAAIESSPQIQVAVFAPGTSPASIQSELANSSVPLSQATIDQIISDVTAGATVTVPISPVAIKDDANNTLVESDVRIVESSDGSILWAFGQFAGGQSGNDINYNQFNLTAPVNQALYTPNHTADTSIFGAQTFDFNSITVSNNANPLLTNAMETAVGDPVNPVTGEFYLEEPADLSIKSLGFALEIKRRYGSQLIYNGPFGFGWGWNHGETLLSATKDGEQILIYSDANRKPAEIIDHMDGSYTYPPGTTFNIEKIESGGTIQKYLIHFKDGRKTEFTDKGLLKVKYDSIEDNTLTFNYEDPIHKSRITSISDTLKRNLTFTYNNNGKVTAVTDFTGRSVRYGYDGDDLVWFEDMEGNVYRYTYLKNQVLPINNHNLTRQTLPNGDYLDIHYYKNDTVSHHTNSNNDTFHFQYSWVNRYAETWNESGYYRKLFWNKNWDVIRILTEDKAVEHNEYDDNHNLIAQTDGNGNRTVFQYDNNRNLVSVTNPEGETQAFEYNSKRRVTKAYVQDGPITEDVLDPGNFYIDVIETESVYDTVATNTLLKEQHTATKSHRMAVTVNGVPILANHKPQLSQSNNITAPVKHVTLFDYDTKGNLVKVTEEVRSFDGSGETLDNEITEHIYDVLGLNRVRTKDALERFTNFTYDDLGRVITVTDPADFTTQVEYDAYGQPTRTVNSVGGVTLNEYDENRRLVKTTNAEGAVSEVIYGTPFYGRNFERVTVETDPLGYTTRHEYDAVGDRIATTDANGNATRFKYDELNRLIEATDALGNVTRNRYDGAGNLIETTDADENVVRFSYDKANRMVRRREMWREQRAVEFEYDERGNLTKEKRGYYYHEVSANNWQIVDGTDANPVLQEPIVVEHEYDKRNRRTETTRYYVDETGHAGDRITELKYDSIGRLCVQIESGPTAVDGTGAPIAPDELRKTEFTYDKAGNITDQKVFAWDPNAIPDPDWEPNPASHIQHDYDDRNLLQATMVIDIDDPGYPTAENAYRQTDYTYDGNGRQKTATIDVGGTDRITETEYDAVGNVVRTRTRAGGTVINANEFTYNARNELVTSTNALGHTQSFTYDGNGNQVTSTDEEGSTSRVFYDALNRQVAVQDALGYTTTFEYDDLGNLTATTTPLGERTTSKYNENKELIEQASPLQTSNAYVEDGIIPVEFIYDEYGRLIRTFDARPDGATGFMQSEITYNNFDEPIKVVQEVTPLGGSLTTPTTITGYDGLGRVLLVKDALGNKTTSEYDVLGRVLKLTQAVGTADETVSEYRYDPAGNRVTEVRASNGVPNTTDDDETNTTFDYDELNRLIATTVTDHPVTPSEVLTSTVTYDDANRTVTTEDPFGVTQTTVSDLAGRRVSRATGGIVSSTWEYDRRGLVIRSDTPDDAATVFEYDARGQLVRQIEAPGSAVEAVTRFKYDANGRQTRVTDPLGYVTQTDYDAAGRMVRTVEALGTADEAITKFHYDANGNLLSVIDANHISDFGKHRVEITAEEFQNEAVRYVYDELNRLTRTYDAGSRTNLGDRSVETVKYDDNGNAVETTLRNVTVSPPPDRVIVRKFDKLDRVVEVRDGSLTGPILQTFAYDKQSRIKTASDTNIDLDSVAPSTAVTYTVEYTYDFAGRTKKEQGYDSTTLAGAQHGHAVEHIYTGINAGGVSLETAKKYYANTKAAPTTAQRTFTYERNMRGLLGSVKSGPTASVVESTYTYGDNARLTSMDMAGGDVTLGLVYDARGRESKRTYTATGSLPTPYTQTTTYDAASNVKNEAITDHYPGYSPSANHNYTYDAQHRLTGDDETIHPWPASTWTYDAVGNWETTNQNLTTASAVDLTANDDNEYTGVDGVPHTHDARGNLIHVGDPAAPADGDRRYAYDWNNRLIRAEVYNTSGGWAVQGDYQYDARNRRTSKKAGAYLTVFAYDGSRVVFELRGTTPANATLTRSYAYNAYVDSPLLMIDEDGSAGTGAGRKFHYLHDRRHSVVALTDGAGGVFEQYRYSAFGRWTVARGPAGFATPVYHQSPAQNPYGYTGRRYDAETATANGSGSGGGDGLWHYRNRTYSATLGRFLQRDPAGYIDGYNLYAYVRNNPMGFVDAFGLSRLFASSSPFADVNVNFTGLPGSSYQSSHRDQLRLFDQANVEGFWRQQNQLVSEGNAFWRPQQTISGVLADEFRFQADMIRNNFDDANRMLINAIATTAGAAADFSYQTYGGISDGQVPSWYYQHPQPDSQSGAYGRRFGRGLSVVISAAETAGGAVTFVGGLGGTLLSPATGPAAVFATPATATVMVTGAAVTAQGVTSFNRYLNLPPVNVPNTNVSYQAKSSNSGGATGQGNQLSGGPTGSSGSVGQTLGKNPNSATLAENMNQAGITRPNNSAAHHIVAGNDRRAARARGILQREGIDINDATNGVFLPQNSKFASPPASTHSSLHTNRYYEELNKRLENASPGEVHDTLRQIADELEAGTFPH
ncbi:MAG: LamG-like jellyroll fold domain-containing protein [Phycisphaerales bacterium]